jgi:hypothetical protein
VVAKCYTVVVVLNRRQCLFLYNKLELKEVVCSWLQEEKRYFLHTYYMYLMMLLMNSIEIFQFVANKEETSDEVLR